MKRLLILLLRWGLGGIFIYAGLVKAIDPGEFLQDIGSYRLVGRWPALLVASLLPWLEIMAGVALVWRRGERGAVRILQILTILFIVSLGQAWIRGLDIRCGCFGKSDALNQYKWWMCRDVLILIGLFILEKASDTSSGHVGEKENSELPI